MVRQLQKLALEVLHGRGSMRRSQIEAVIREVAPRLEFTTRSLDRALARLKRAKALDSKNQLWTSIATAVNSSPEVFTLCRDSAKCLRDCDTTGTEISTSRSICYLQTDKPEDKDKTSLGIGAPSASTAGTAAASGADGPRLQEDDRREMEAILRVVQDADSRQGARNKILGNRIRKNRDDVEWSRGKAAVRVREELAEGLARRARLEVIERELLYVAVRAPGTWIEKSDEIYTLLLRDVPDAYREVASTIADLLSTEQLAAETARSERIRSLAAPVIDVSAARTAILMAVADGHASPAQFCELQAKANHSTVRVLFMKMVAAGQLVRVGYGRYAIPPECGGPAAERPTPPPSTTHLPGWHWPWGELCNVKTCPLPATVAVGNDCPDSAADHVEIGALADYERVVTLPADAVIEIPPIVNWREVERALIASVQPGTGDDDTPAWLCDDTSTDTPADAPEAAAANLEETIIEPVHTLQASPGEQQQPSVEARILALLSATDGRAMYAHIIAAAVGAGTWDTGLALIALAAAGRVERVLRRGVAMYRAV